MVSRAYITLIPCLSSLTMLKNYLNSTPREYWHGRVMNNMEQGQLVVLLTEHKEERVHEVDKLGEKVPPGHAQSE